MLDLGCGGREGGLQGEGRGLTRYMQLFFFNALSLFHRSYIESKPKRNEGKGRERVGEKVWCTPHRFILNSNNEMIYAKRNHAKVLLSLFLFNIHVSNFV